MFDLISIGDTVIDTFLPIEQAKIMVDPETHQQMLAVPYGAKVPVEEAVSTIGGNAANNAIGVSRLGLKTAIYTNLGSKDDDEADDRVRARFKKEKIDTRYVVDHSNLPTSHHIVLTYKGERTILVHHQSWKYNLPDLDKTRFVYLTSMAPNFEKTNIMQQLTNYCERVGARLMFNPGTYQIKHGVKKYPRLLSLTEFFVVNKEEAKLILGYKVEEDVSMKKLLSLIHSLGPKLVVITDGKEGSFGFDGEKYYKLDMFKGKLVEMTGAGDSYGSGAIAALSHGEPLPVAMRWGAANASSVCEYVGPITGLLHYRTLQQRLKEFGKIVAKEF
jgi:sugar/nucleoside kinase (ribokinase family)